MGKIGITEAGDAGLDFSWANKINEVDGAILISKELNEKLIAGCVAFKDKVILHLTVTGFGGSKIEPYVPKKEEIREQLDLLKYYKFPIEHVVLRVDPIVPTTKGIKTAESVLKLFADSGIKRCRYSFLDMYSHVKERFNIYNVGLPYETFNAPKELMKNAVEMLKRYEGIYEFESCAEVNEHQLGCISEKDMKILNLDTTLVDSSMQRGNCLCPSNKLELLGNKRRCKHGCLYCYWKD